VLTVPAAHAQTNQPAEILLSPDGRCLYVTNRGDDTLAVFVVDPDTGHLTLKGQIATHGVSPRHVAIDQSGKIMAICNQQSHEVRLFRLGADGLPQLAGFPIAVGNPTCARFF
jgi:6-phosphogluconolactonase